MNRVTHKVYLPGLSMLLILAGCLHLSPGSSSKSTLVPTTSPIPTASVTVIPMQVRPNLVVILTDDLDLVLGSIDHMPILQKELVNQGLRFENFLVTDAVCCPSRVTFLRGQYNHNHSVYTNVEPSGSFTKFNSSGGEGSTLATWLQSAGYRTGFLGKYMNGYPDKNNLTYIPPGWNTWVVPAHGKPYVGLNYELNDNGRQIPYGDQPQDYLTDVLSKKAAAFIQGATNDPAPIFLYISTYAPHEPAIPADRHKSLFSDLSAPRTVSFNEEDVSDKPANIASDPPLTTDEIAKLDELFLGRLRTLMAVDEMISVLLQSLKDVGRLENTYIIFTSDNGYHLGQHRMKWGKATPYEEDIHVPFIVRGPGVPEGQVVTEFLAGNIDLAPTLAELAGVIPPDFVDGRSLVPMLSLGVVPNTWRKGYLIEHYALSEGGDDTGQGLLMVEYSDFPGAAGKPDPAETNLVKSYAAIVTRQYKYIEYIDGFRELYDLHADPHELQNIVNITDPALIEELAAWLHALETCAGQSCRQIDGAQP